MNEKTNENLAVEARISKPPEEWLNTERIFITREKRGPVKKNDILPEI